MHRRSFLAMIAIALVGSVAGQNLSIGIIGGGSLTDAAHDFTTSYSGAPSSRVWSPSKDWMAGATIEYRIRSRFSVEVDGIYRELHVTWASVLPNGTLNSVSPSPVVTWEFPVLAKYRFGQSNWKPFVEAGPSFRTTGNLNFYPSHYGGTAGFGVETRRSGWTFAPVVRYTRWAPEINSGGAGHLQANQLELLLGIGRTSESNLSPVGSRISLGAVAGYGLNPDFANGHYQSQAIEPGLQPGGGYTYTSVNATQYVSGLRSLIAGPSVEIHLNLHWSVEMDALHKLLRSTYWTVSEDGVTSAKRTTTNAATWQFPILAKYGFRWGKVNPFIEGGPSFRLPQQDLSTYGVTGGAGVAMHLRALKIAPAVRFTHWGADSGFGPSGVVRNEASALVGFSFGGPRVP
jgi:hypothetical protein